MSYKKRHRSLKKKSFSLGGYGSRVPVAGHDLCSPNSFEEVASLLLQCNFLLRTPTPRVLFPSMLPVATHQVLGKRWNLDGLAEMRGAASGRSYPSVGASPDRKHDPDHVSFRRLPAVPGYFRRTYFHRTGHARPALTPALTSFGAPSTSVALTPDFEWSRACSSISCDESSDTAVRLSPDTPRPGTCRP